MSAINQQKDSNNDDEDVVPTTTSNSSNNDDRDATSVKDGQSLQLDDSKAVEQSPSSVIVTKEILEQVTEESNMDKTGGSKNELCAGDTKTLNPEPMETEINILQNNAIEIEVTKDIPTNDSVQSLPNLNTELIPTTTGYKETVIDSVSDSDLELRWTDDDDEDLIESNAKPTNDTALTQPGTDTEIEKNEISKGIEDNQKLAENLEPDVSESPIEAGVGKELTNPIQNEEQTKLVKTDFEATDEATSSSTINDTANVLSESGSKNGVVNVNMEKHVDKEFNITDNITTSSETIDKSTTEPAPLMDQKEDKERSDTVLEQRDSTTNPTCSDEKIISMDVDVASIKSESIVAESNVASDKTDLESQSMVENALKHLVKDLDVVDEDDKISEIDIDETIVDLKHLIDQDEDTIKQLGLDVNTDENVDKIQQSTVNQNKNNKEQSETAKTDSNLAENVPMDVDLPPAIESNITTSTEISNPDSKSIKNEIQDESTTLVNEKKPLSSKTDTTQTSKTLPEISKSLSENIEIEIKTEIIENKSELKEIDDKISTITEENDVENNSIIPKIEEDSTEKPVINDNNETIQETTNDSMKINTEHRINRPDVMLDIPTQEFDLDDDFDNSSETQKSSGKGDSNMTLKTVTEIVNQLSKDLEKESDKTINTTNADMIISESKSDDKRYSNTDIDKNTTKDNSNCNVQEEVQSKKQMTDEKSKKSDELLEKAKTDDEPQISERNLQQSTDPNICTTKLELDKHLTENSKHVQGKQPSEKSITAETIKKSDDLPNSDDKINEKPSLKNEDNDPKTVKTSQNNDKDSKCVKTSEKNDDIDSNTLEPTTTKVKSTENSEKSETSTSEITKITPDNAEEETEVTDRLGLLAESSRVMDDDDDEQEPDDDDADEDDDDEFDQDDDGSSNLHSEESNPPASEVDIQELEDAKDTITIVENESLISEAAENIDKIPLIQAEKNSDDTILKKEKEIATEINKKQTDESQNVLKSPTKNDEPISETKKSPDKLKTLEITKLKNILNYVDLEESSSEDDALERKKLEKSDDATESPEKDNKDSDEIAQEVCKDKKKDDKLAEIFNLDSDEDDKADANKEIQIMGQPRENNQCVNQNCTSDEKVPYYEADRITLVYYGAARWKRRAVCANCLDAVNARNEGLVSGIKDLRPLMMLRMAKPIQQLLEISDSDSEGDDEPVGETGATILEEQLPELLNEVWLKYKMDDRLKTTENYLETELDKMQRQSEEIDQLLKDCQKATDQLRLDFYSGFEQPRKELPAITLLDTPIASYTCLESEEDNDFTQTRYPKRSSTSTIENAAKKQAIPLGYVESETRKVTRSSIEQNKTEEDKDISVVRLSAETAPADLPPPGELVKPPLRVGSQVFAMKNQYGAWLKGKVLEILPKVENQYTQCRIRFEHKLKNPCKLITGRSLAYTEPSETRMTIGTRVIALFINSDTSSKRDSYYYSGIVAEIPNPVNSYRYLVFFDDGYAQYVHHRHTRLVYESSAFVWEEVHPFSRDFVCNYLMKYPERAMVRMHPGQWLTVERNGQWWETKVIKVDAALVCVKFPDDRTEWIYRGSTRLQPLFTELQAAKRADRARLPRSTKASNKTNMPYVEYTRTDDQMKSDTQQPPEWNSSSSWDLRRQRVAKKSTAVLPYIPTTPVDAVVSRVVYYTPKNSVRPYKLVPHTCSPQCKRTDVLSLDDLKSYNPLTRPLLSGWERQIIRHKATREIMYRAPCGRRLRSMPELHRYLRAIQSDMAVDLFDFTPNTHCLAEFVLNKSNVQKKDLAQGKENIPVPCVNYYDHSLPEFCLYNTERVPKAGVPLNLDPEFLCGCDCDDDCVDKTKCACWKMTLEGAKTIGIDGPNVGYEYRRLPEPLPTGIYECNSRCKCKSTCLNRVVQNPLQLKLQVFKTLNRGWGIRALNDVPKGAFLCIYAGNLLTDATANLDGLNEGDEYLAELDYIEVVEAMKEGYEEDIPEAIKELDKKETEKSGSEPESESSASEDESRSAKSEKADDDFQPGYLAFGLQEFSKRLRRRDKTKKNKKDKNSTEEQVKDEKEQNDVKPEMKNEEGDDCITISDDEEVAQREPARFAAQENMSDSKVVSKYRSIRSYFGKDEACYIMDAKVQGNIGRYLNHSCSPNVFVQNVFVDTHDPRFPWVSFFALHHIKAGTELTWNYNYDVGSVPGKVLYCFCGSPNCRGRLL